ncbi:MAG: glycine--tRNA ligase subunit beta [Kangiellaceae bacterium]|nr:glycine--tRNA ligase subunit beta [Kangiellaceae bacterium]
MTKKDFLFELGCEELPPKALIKLANSLLNSVSGALDKLGLDYEQCEYFATPRRLAIRFNQLDSAQPDKQVEKLGPAVAAAYDGDGNPKPAAIGFAKSNGVDVGDLSTKSTDKGERLAFVAEVRGQETVELLPEILSKAINQLPVPKAMRWGDSQFQFSRPIHWITTLFGDSVVEMNAFGVSASNFTFGHRFHSPEKIQLNSATQYEKALKQAYVVACFEERKAQIRTQVEKVAKDINAIAVVSESLLEEVAALVEWPVALLGSFEKEFLDVPSEALVSSMAEHQKYFHLVDSNNDLLPHFITIANIESRNSQSVVDGNEKVIRPRLADAKFFYDSDRRNPLDFYVEKLKKVVFQTKLGSVYDKSQRIGSLSSSIAKSLNADAALVSRASELCKCDLMTNMVGEFSDLQGIMGRYYAIKDGEHADVAAAMDEIYMPRFAGDKLPKSQVGTILSISDRVDTLVGIFGIGQLPTGAKDPFALRRASLGVLRLITENKLDLDLEELIEQSLLSYQQSTLITLKTDTKKELLSFIYARASALYQDKGIAIPIIKSVQTLKISKPTDVEARINAVHLFSQKIESSDLAEANKRVKNILEKSNFESEDVVINKELFGTEETQLFNTISSMKGFVSDQVADANYGAALDKLAGMKDVVNKFFDSVMINANEQAVRNNRLALISELRNLFIGIADISLLQK